MQVILSHINLDFDGLASMLAAKKLYPNAKLVLPTKQAKSVERFLAIHRDSFNLYYPNQITWDSITEVILVDIASLQRIGEVSNYINKEKVDFIVYDHHQHHDGNVTAKCGIIDPIGATITLLVEILRDRNIAISSFEATIFALGLYTDTGSFTYLNTTPRDLKAGSYLLECGANLQLVSKFSESPLQEEEQKLLHSLIQQSEEHYFQGVDILIAYHQQKEYTGGLALLARKALEMTGTDALIFVVEMGKRTFIVGRSTSDRIDVLPIIKRLGGGGHPKAASAMVKNGDFQTVLETVRAHITETVKPSLIAKDIMSSPVKVISTATSIEEAAKMMLRYGHTGFPVLENGKLVGIISRRDVDKAKHHGLGHAPVKGYMSTEPTTIHSNMSIEEVQNLMIDKNVGRLPVIEDQQLIGIISRTNVIEALHGEKMKTGQVFDRSTPIEISLIERIEKLLPENILELLKTIGEKADNLNYRAYMIGGIVRDLVIGRQNDDIDIVVEGDGIYFAKLLANSLGGSVRVHEKFGTATWKHLSGLKIDITSARTEYYEYPSALPTVEMSSLREDLLRRDFTINAMALQINKSNFGKLIDFFHGYKDIDEKKVKILYNLSFVEDPTRILRAVRFEQRFGFEMDKQTLELAQISVDKISSTSKPRLAHELNKLLMEENPVEAICRLQELGVLNYLVGPNNFDIETIQLLERFKVFVDEVTFSTESENSCNEQLWICYLAILFFKQENGLQLVKDFALNNEHLHIVDEIYHLVTSEQALSDEIQLGNLHKLLKKFKKEAIICFAILKNLPEVKTKLIKTYLIARMAIPKLIDGRELKALNIPPSPLFSKILLEIECAYLNKDIFTKKDALRFVKNEYL
ncbi:CBS domain-containing protein [Anaerobacillus isosaccharinicus]|uniref:CBS domain-containing protein n=1 Tax=Anaerobacillus isosaccharinicus TaxID=1532552 RepID=A0A1S2LTP6_9BACI|nr:CBS domain-containing protein [Anaerobacillus isosaccharinicus]MBA5585445.1 CBS domain-containing protein [Anaerobacillus isosaccharinicus]QOY36237.1 CBS domain-containing protein [Anaerobacillus isosaccharinicus]